MEGLRRTRPCAAAGDERPDLFDQWDARNLFWEFKWVAGDLPEWPQISRAQALAVLDDMQRRYELAGHGLSAVRAARFRYAYHTGDPASEDLRTLWLATPRDEFSQCIACEPGEQALQRLRTSEGPLVDVLRVTARWQAWLPGARWVEALEVVNEWNATRLFPRAVISRYGDGDVCFTVDRNCNLEFGVTDRQLANELQIMIFTAKEFFEHLKERFPGAREAAEAYRAEHG